MGEKRLLITLWITVEKPLHNLWIIHTPIPNLCGLWIIETLYSGFPHDFHNPHTS